MEFYQYAVGNRVTVRGGKGFCAVVWRGYLLLPPPGRRVRVAPCTGWMPAGIATTPTSCAAAGGAGKTGSFCVAWRLTLIPPTMAQKVITEGYETTGNWGASFGLNPNGELDKAMKDGWRIVSTSSAAMPGTFKLFVTYVLEKEGPVVA